MMLRNLPWCFLLCLSVGLQAQSPDIQFVRFDTHKGLSHNQINCFLKDRRGFLWVGTQAGLNRFDGYSFRVFRNNQNDSTSLPNDYVYNLMEDPSGRIWVGDRRNYSVFDPKTEQFYRNADQWAGKFGLPDARVTRFLKSKTGDYWINHLQAGLCRYDTRSGKLASVFSAGQGMQADPVADFREDSEGRLWIVRRSGTLEQFDPESRLVIFRSDHLSRLNAGGEASFNLFIDQDDDIWLFSEDLMGGQYFEQRTRRFFAFNTNSSLFKLNNDLVRAITQDDEGFIWVATDHGGITLINKQNKTVRYLLNDPDDEHSLSQNSAISMYRDSSGAIWIGTFKKGFNLYHKSVFKFPLICHQPSDPRSLPENDVNDFAEDASGNLWIGSNGGGLIYFDRKNNRFTQYRNIPGNPNSLSNDVIVSIYIDRRQKLWIGTYFGGLNCFDGKKFTRYLHDPADPNSLSDDRVWEIFEDSRNNLWVGTLRGGLNLFDREKGTFRRIRAQQGGALQSDYVSALTEDSDGNLWIGTDRGVDVLERQSGTFAHYENDPSDKNSLSNNVVTSILEDGQGNIWVATLHGLNLTSKYNRTFRTFGKKDGLPDDVIMSLVEDDAHGLWMGTPNGLSNLRFTVRESGMKKDISIRNFNELEGLQGREFNENAVCKTSRGELIFGGANGFNIFFPEQTDHNPGCRQVVLTDIQIFNRSIRPLEEVDGRVVLEHSITETRELTLNHSQNVFSIEFATLNFFHPEKNAYFYKMEGFNDEWYEADNSTRKATYTNLDPGEYVFKVRVANEAGKWTESEGLKIRILPPFWRSDWAYLLYFLATFGALLFARLILLDRERMKFRMEQERLEAQRTHELDLLKIKFLTNISHEFRTPLTLILTPLERLLQAGKTPEEHAQVELMHRNAKRLLNLVNQLLDFKKLEVEEAKFVPAQSDLVPFIREITYSFAELAGQKHIGFSFNSRAPSLPIVFDQAKMSRIMYNLLSNAFKFTPENGQVSVQIEQVGGAGPDGPGLVEIRVADTGIGIPPEAQDKIFDRFFQDDGAGHLVNQGSGIGLSITREFVRLHDGTIRVESEEGKGSTFIIRLPVRIAEKELESAREEIPAAPAATPPETSAGDLKKPRILLIDDNADFRSYLKDLLKHQYDLLEAPDGKTGLEVALDQVPDLVLSDVIMPEMDGIELCRRIKADYRISHIPVILLTARSAEEQQLLGYETGADAYITKPFQLDILTVRIQNLIRQREPQHKKRQRFVDVSPSDVNITSLDEQLIQKATALVEENIANAGFSVEDLSHALAMSRVYLYKKLLALTGRTPIEFIRIIRLKRAAQLLEKSQLTVAEVAYKVGFNNPKYFAKYFKEEFGMLPTSYQKRSKSPG